MTLKPCFTAYPSLPSQLSFIVVATLSIPVKRKLTAEAPRAQSKEFLITNTPISANSLTTMLESLRGWRKLFDIWNIRTQGIDSRQDAKHAKFGGKR
jgi:hypothetical protein